MNLQNPDKLENAYYRNMLENLFKNTSEIWKVIRYACRSGFPKVDKMAPLAAMRGKVAKRSS